MIILVLAVAYFFSPLFDGIIMGMAFAYAAKPIKNKLKNIPFSSLFATLIIVIPVFFLLFYGVYTGISQAIYVLTHLKEYQQYFAETLEKHGIKIDERIHSYIESIFNYLQNRLSGSAVELTTGAVLILLNFLISAIVCYYFLTSSEHIFSRVVYIVPEERREDLKKFIFEVDKTLTSLWFGNFVFALLMGLASLPFFIIFKVPFAPLLSALMFLAALIPVFAEWMVILPVGVYLILKDLWTGVTFLIIGVIFFYMIPELFIRPYFVGTRAKIHPVLLMLAFIGGGLVAGIKGFFLAPIVVAIVVTTFNYVTSNVKQS